MNQKVGGILAKSAPKKGKTTTIETLHQVFMKMTVYEDVSVSKGVHKQKLCNLQKSL